jgi:hypothetical protein
MSNPYDAKDPMVKGVLDGKLRAVSRLIARGTSVNRPARHPSGALLPLVLVASQETQKQMLELLLDHHAHIDTIDSYTGGTALTIACAKGDLPIAQMLVERGASVNHALKDGCTSLIFACQEGRLAIGKCMLYTGSASPRRWQLICASQ